VYGRPAQGIAQACADRGVALHVFAWQPRMARAGLTRDAFYLVRPDAYVALADEGRSPARLLEWSDTHFRPAAGRTSRA
jgi:hypothetical protein